MKRLIGHGAQGFGRLVGHGAQGFGRLGGGLAVAFVVNAAILAGVAWNRSAREAEVTLTERELRLVETFDSDEDTGLALRLAWNQAGDDDGSIRWLDRRKLAELGFDVSVPPNRADAADVYREALPRAVYVVLEQDGAAWRRWLAAQERQLAALRREVAAGRRGSEDLRIAEQALANDRRAHSRLFAVDAGPDAAALRRRHPDRARLLVLPGQARLWLLQAGSETAHLGGGLHLANDRLHVPLALRPVLDAVIREQRARRAAESRRAMRGESDDDEPVPLPDYGATVAVGRRHEPWLLRVERLDP